VDAAELPTAYQAWFPRPTRTQMCTISPRAGLSVSEVAELPVNAEPDAHFDFNDLT